MITATNPIVSANYDGFTIAQFAGERRAPGVCAVSFVAVPCRVIDAETLATEVYPDPARRVEVTLPNAFAPAYVSEEEPSYGEWWTDALRLRVMLWMQEGEDLAGIIGKARGGL